MATTRRLHLVTTTLVLVAATVVAMLVSMSGGERRQVAAAHEGATTAPAVVEVSLYDCGSTWAPGPAGAQEIALHNADFHPGEVRVVGVDPAHQRQVFAELEPFGPDTT